MRTPKYRKEGNYQFYVCYKHIGEDPRIHAIKNTRDDAYKYAIDFQRNVGHSYCIDVWVEEHKKTKDE